MRKTIIRGRKTTKGVVSGEGNCQLKLEMKVKGEFIMKKKVCMALMAVLTAAALAGCGGTENKEADTSAQAESTTETEADGTEKADSGEITVYTALEDEQVSEYLAKFNETYPDIIVNVVRESTGIITAKLIAEKDNPQADVIWERPLPL